MQLGFASGTSVYLHHVEERGIEFFRSRCDQDLEGIVAKRKGGRYRDGVEWIKIKNPEYSQARGGRNSSKGCVRGDSGSAQTMRALKKNSAD